MHFNTIFRFEIFKIILGALSTSLKYIKTFYNRKTFGFSWVHIYWKFVKRTSYFLLSWATYTAISWRFLCNRWWRGSPPGASQQSVCCACRVLRQHRRLPQHPAQPRVCVRAGLSPRRPESGGQLHLQLAWLLQRGETLQQSLPQVTVMRI